MPRGHDSLLHDLCGDTVGCLSRLHREYGSIVEFAKSTDRTVFAFGPDANHDVLSDTASFHVWGPPGPKNSAQRRFGLGLFGLNGDKQRQHRRLFMPALSKSASEASVFPMRAILEEMLAGWSIGQSIDLAAEMKELALRIAARLLFGLNDLTGPHEVAAAFQDWLDNYVKVNFTQTLPLDLKAEEYKAWLAAGEHFEVMLRKLIRQREATLEDHQHDLLAILLRARQTGEISDGEVIGEVQTLLNASYQTTASALTWTLLLLNQHPEIAERVVHDTERMPGANSITERAIKESLRILPPVVFVIRRCVKASRVAGHEIATDSIVVLSQYVTHHMADLFAAPELYDPDRWLTLKPSAYAYLPFGAGARMCSGTAFSTQLFHLVIPTILRRFRLNIAAQTRVDRHSTLTMNVHGALPVTLGSPRDPFMAKPLIGTILEMVHLPQSETSRMPVTRAA